MSKKTAFFFLNRCALFEPPILNLWIRPCVCLSVCFVCLSVCPHFQHMIILVIAHNGGLKSFSLGGEMDREPLVIHLPCFTILTEIAIHNLYGKLCNKASKCLGGFQLHVRTYTQNLIQAIIGYFRCLWQFHMM